MSDTTRNKGFMAKHAKSSAALVSLGIHAVLILVALTFVAVTVVTKDDQKFEAKPVNRPKMQLKKLQVPVNIKKKKTQKPKLRKRIVVKPKLSQSVPDIKMPEITGVKGGLGNAAGGGLGGAGGLGFNMPEIELFGIKGKGEKIFIVLDASGFMMENEIGGIPAYTIIKSELVRILEELNSAVMFNIAIYGGGNKVLFPNLVPASMPNVNKVKDWLEPLNAVSKGMGDKDYGTKTAGPGALDITGANTIKPLQSGVGEWAGPTLEAMRQQADTVFILSCRWGFLAYKEADAEEWSEAKMARYNDKLAQARAKLKEENEKLRAAGKPPRVIAGNPNKLLHAYFPGEPCPPRHEWVGYTPKDMLEAFVNMRESHKQKDSQLTSGLGKRNQQKDRFTVNVVHFTKVDTEGKEANFIKLTSSTRGDYRQIKGMEAIESYVEPE